jgi:hypothetical protein
MHGGKRHCVVSVHSWRPHSTHCGHEPQPSPIAMFYGSFDLFVELAMLPGIESGALSRPDMIDVVAALRAWENDGTWTRAYAG